MAAAMAHAFGASGPRTRPFGSRGRRTKTRATSLELVNPEDGQEVRGERRPPVLLALPGGDVEQLLAFPLIEAIKRKCVIRARRRGTHPMRKEKAHVRTRRASGARRKDSTRRKSRPSLERLETKTCGRATGRTGRANEADLFFHQESWMLRGRAPPKPRKICVWNQSQRSVHLRGRTGRRSQA